jgi:hypothetical protein
MMSLHVRYQLSGNQLFLDTIGLFRWPQHVPRDLGGFYDRCLVCVNDNSISVQRCIRDRGTLGPLAHSFLKQGRS